jgi:nucleoside-diphosphate-sugar epimerase
LTERVLITGASGFIGYHLVHALVNAGHEVFCLVRPTSDISAIESFNVSFVEGDITRLETLVGPVSKVKTVFHLAASTVSFTEEMHTQVNVGGTKNIALACAKADQIPKLIVVSSSGAVGPSPANRPMIEKDPPSPVSMYGRSKLAGENAAAEWAGKVPISIVRPAIVFGEFEKDMFRMFQLVSRGWHLVVGLKAKRLSLIHAADLAKALIMVASHGERLPSMDERSKSPGQGIYFIADEWAPTYAELGPMIAESLGCKARLVKMPGLIVWGVALVFEVLNRIRRQPSILNLDKAKEGMSGDWVYSPQKIKEQLGFEPDKSVQERIIQTGKWYREQGWL